MRHYTCDVCGAEMPSGYERISKKSAGLTALCQLEDVCERCHRIGNRISVKDVLLAAWKDALKMALEETETTNDQEVFRAKKLPPRCSAADEKTMIYERLKRFRGTPPKLGRLNELSEVTKGKISADDLRGILADGTAVPIDVWRTIGKALDKLGA